MRNISVNLLYSPIDLNDWGANHLDVCLLTTNAGNLFIEEMFYVKPDSFFRRAYNWRMLHEYFKEPS